MKIKITSPCSENWDEVKICICMMLLGSLVMMNCVNNAKKSNISSSINRTEIINATNIPNVYPPQKLFYERAIKQYNFNTDRAKGIKSFKDGNTTLMPISYIEIPRNTNDPNYIYNNVGKLPVFKGGTDAFQKFIDNNMIFPKWEKENKIEGRVFIQFVVERDGKITYPVVIKATRQSKNLQKEALRLIQLMPKWEPGKNNDMPVRSSYIMPIVFEPDS